MATMDILKANYEGTLGQTIGCKWKDLSVIKSKPMGVSPHNQAQKDAFTAFGSLNRLAAQLAKYLWQHAGWKDNKMLRHNVFCAWLKPLVKNRVFNPENINDVLPLPKLYNITHAVQPHPGLPITLRVSLNGAASIPPDTQLHLLAVDTAGYCGVVYTYPIADGTITITPPIPQERDLMVLYLTSGMTKNKTTLYEGGCIGVNGMQYSLDEVLTDDLWLDGKPLYRKTINVGNVSTSSQLVEVNHNIQNLQYVVKIEATQTFNSGSIRSVIIPGGISPITAAVYFTNSLLRLQCNLGVSSAINTVYVTMWYTKSTD